MGAGGGEIAKGGANAGQSGGGAGLAGAVKDRTELGEGRFGEGRARAGLRARRTVSARLSSTMAVWRRS